MSEETRTAVVLGKIGLTEAEIAGIKQDITGQLGGVRLGYNEEGKPGYYTTDETGADTVIPFSSGGGGGKLYFNVLNLVAYANNGNPSYSYKTSMRLDVTQYKKITTTGGNLLARAHNATVAFKIILTISGYKEGQTTPTTLLSKETGQTKSLNPGISATLEEMEINIEDYSEILIESRAGGNLGTGYVTLNNLTLE